LATFFLIVFSAANVSMAQGKEKRYEGFEDDESESRRHHVAAHRLSFASDPVLRRE